MAEEKGYDKDQGNDRKRDQGELPVEMKEEDNDPDHQKNIFDEVNQNRSKHFMDILDIVRQSGHQSSHRILIKKGDGEVLEMGEDLHPEVVHHLLACHLHGIDLREI
jgi:geranylgeranyl pyrophosphate synthase